MPMTVQEKFEKFDRENEVIYRWFKRFAYELLRAGCKRLSAKLIIERIRWETTVSTGGAGWHPGRGRPFLIDNRFTAWYARKFIADFPMHADKFELREIRTP